MYHSVSFEMINEDSTFQPLLLYGISHSSIEASILSSWPHPITRKTHSLEASILSSWPHPTTRKTHPIILKTLPTPLQTSLRKHPPLSSCYHSSTLFYGCPKYSKFSQIECQQLSFLACANECTFHWLWFNCFLGRYQHLSNTKPIQITHTGTGKTNYCFMQSSPLLIIKSLPY